jgi:glycosyltransferase involved in cell wall biosynthesis
MEGAALADNPPALGEKPLVSIVVPSYQQGRFIRETLDSCLNQDYRPIEILVLDGGSQDDTVSVLESFDAAELRWWSEPDRGVVDAVNKGLALARGDVLTIQSSDDVFAPGAVGTMVRALLAKSEAGLAYGDVELNDAHSQPIGRDVQGEFDFCEYLGRLQYIPQPGACFTRAAYEAVGPWRESVSYAADADFWMRIASRFAVVHVTRIVGHYRYHEEQRDRQRLRIGHDWCASIDDLTASGALTPRQVRFARMGKALAKYRYAPEGDWVGRTRSLYTAFIENPTAIMDPRFPKRELLPGRDPLWRRLSLMKRALGIPARTSS